MRGRVRPSGDVEHDLAVAGRGVADRLAGGAAIAHVGPGVAGDEVVAGLAEELVVAGPAPQLVVARSAGEPIVACAWVSSVTDSRATPKSVSLTASSGSRIRMFAGLTSR